jgi:hypothetical protein
VQEKYLNSHIYLQYYSLHIKAVYFSVTVHILAIFITVDRELKEIKRTTKLIYGAAASACSRPLN